MDNLLTLTLFGSVVAFWSVILAFIIILFVCESTKSGVWAFATFVVVTAGCYFYSNFKILEYISVAKVIIYLIIGLLFSLIRCYFYSRRIRNKIIAKKLTDIAQNDALKSAKTDIKDELQDNVFRWWFMWPASFLYWIFSDLFKDIYDQIYSLVASTYTAIVDSAFK